MGVNINYQIEDEKSIKHWGFNIFFMLN